MEEEASFDASKLLLFCFYANTDILSCGYSEAILSMVCHPCNLFTNEYQSEKQDNFLLFFQRTKRRRMWPDAAVIQFQKTILQMHTALWVIK